LIKNFSFSQRNRQFVFTPKIQYELVAERSEANQNHLKFPTWCRESLRDAQYKLRCASHNSSHQKQNLKMTCVIPNFVPGVPTTLKLRRINSVVIRTTRH